MVRSVRHTRAALERETTFALQIIPLGIRPRGTHRATTLVQARRPGSGDDNALPPKRYATLGSSQAGCYTRIARRTPRYTPRSARPALAAPLEQARQLSTGVAAVPRQSRAKVNDIRPRAAFNAILHSSTLGICPGRPNAPILPAVCLVRLCRDTTLAPQSVYAPRGRARDPTIVHARILSWVSCVDVLRRRCCYA